MQQNQGKNRKQRTKYSRLSTNLQSNTRGSSLSVIDSLGTSFDVSADAVVVAGMEVVQVAESVESDGVFGGIVSGGGGVVGDFALCHII